MLAVRFHSLATRNGDDVEILVWIDDHSRYVLSLTAHERITGPIVVATFTDIVATYGIPVSTLTGNGMVYTAALLAVEPAATASKPC